MKSIIRKKLFFSFVIIGSLLFAACDLESSSNGKLDGYWHLTSIDTIDTEGSFDLSRELRFWSVQNKLLQLVDRQQSNKSYYLRFQYSGSSLEVSDPYIDEAQETDTPMEDITLLRHYGIEKIPTKYNIETLSGSKMVLSSGNIRLRFTRF